MDSSNGVQYLRMVGGGEPSNILWTVFMWCLGMIDNYHPQSDVRDSYSLTGEWSPNFNRRLLSATAVVCHVLIILGSILIFVWSIDCFAESQMHTMFTISFVVFYWPVIMSASVICVVAKIKRNLKRRGRGFGSPGVITWCEVFDEMSFKGKLHNLTNRMQAPNLRTFILGFMYLLVIGIGVMESLWFSSHPSECKSPLLLLNLILQITNSFIYSTFCFYLYLQRKLLENDCNIAVEYIQKNSLDRGRCILRVKAFFREYYQLRKLMFPWLNAIVFSNAFGMTFFATWRFLDDGTIPLSSVQPPIVPQSGGALKLCNRSCAQDFLVNAHFSVFFTFQVMCEKSIMLLFALIAVGGIDLRHQWERFKMKMYLHDNPEDERWKRLSDFVERLHPDTSSDVIASFIIPLLGLAAGVMSGQYVS